ncbi:MAG: PspC domain-containing protein [Candidatus Cloacimonetes bacterium]|nr:PspC domain-containing protein [Candidatus Cloacimonadota bacterium]
MATKIMTKSRSKRMLSGVCGGLSNHFGIDANLIRVLWIFFGATGVGVLIYVLMSLFLPVGE